MAEQAEQRPSLMPGAWVGPYEIVRRIGRGGNAEIFHVRREG
jgi:hypothetical protein